MIKDDSYFITGKRVPLVGGLTGQGNLVGGLTGGLTGSQNGNKGGGGLLGLGGAPPRPSSNTGTGQGQQQPPKQNPQRPPTQNGGGLLGLGVLKNNQGQTNSRSAGQSNRGGASLSEGGSDSDDGGSENSREPTRGGLVGGTGLLG